MQDDESEGEGERPSRSSSLLQFENLERHCDSRLSHDSLEAADRWRPTDSPDSLEDSDEDAVSRSFSSRSGNGSFRSLGLRSSRSFDSLVLCQAVDKPNNSFLGGELSQSLNNTSLPSETPEPPPAPRGIYKTVECLTEVQPHVACARSVVSKGQQASETSTQGERSAENLSEDSGFGEHTSSTDLATTSSRDTQSTERDRDSRSGDETAVTMMGWDKQSCDARAKYNQHFNWQSAPDLAQCEPEPDLFHTETADDTLVVVEVPSSESTSTGTHKMSSRFSSVASTPNLYTATQEFLASERSSEWRSTVSLSRGKCDSVSRLSSATASSRGSRGSNLQITTSFVNLGSSHNGSSKGVHFCPVVSEVSWRESSASSEDSGSEVDDVESDETPPFEQLVERLRASPAPVRVSEREERRRVITELSTLRQERESHVGCAPPAPRTLSHSPAAVEQRPASAMDEQQQQRVNVNAKKKHGGGIGGFFQRFNFRRLSGRDKNKKDKKKKVLVNSSTTTQQHPVRVREVHEEEDFKIIPLHDPPGVQRKPTPPEPPPSRACAPRRPQRSPVMASATAARGLLETDIDSDIAPASKKTRSLLNLDDGRNTLKPCPVQREDSRESDSRAKSMEFLLDKENQAAIKVRPLLTSCNTLALYL